MSRSESQPTLHSEPEYEAALSEIRQLWDAPIGTPEGAKLDQLIDAVVAYEDIHYAF